MSELMVLDAEPIKAEIAPVVAYAQAIFVRDVHEHEEALDHLRSIAKAERTVKEKFADPKRKAHEAHKAITALEASLLEPLKGARDLISKKCAMFEGEQRKIAEEEERKQRAAAEAAQEEQRLIDAAMAPTEEAAEEALTEPLPPPIVIVQAEVAKAAGVSSRKHRSGEIVDKRAFVQACLSRNRLDLVLPHMVSINGQIRAEGDDYEFPGVRVVETVTHAVR